MRLHSAGIAVRPPDHERNVPAESTDIEVLPNGSLGIVAHDGDREARSRCGFDGIVGMRRWRCGTNRGDLANGQLVVEPCSEAAMTRGSPYVQHVWPVDLRWRLHSPRRKR